MIPLTWTVHRWTNADVRTLAVVNTETGVTAFKDFDGRFVLEMSGWTIHHQWYYLTKVAIGMTVDAMQAEAVF
jgi:hypothetical protein